MVATAFLDAIGKGISSIFNNLGNNGGRSGGGGGNVLGDAITTILDPDKQNPDGNGFQNIIKTFLNWALW